ncbi:hypothetical protein E6W36_02335 [Hankyongella ginsenosidimutans]|uniref:Uncharacterized protein n=1 Tax=Hankyongella ginsenosidimutans TaxID=1763828 RepID=A0A4D7C5F9_9SPHN|nr:hypothetical protein [Hankyongella ginsenosidimutans]QCI78860.1 hypothetical protein E6W36_02335 [Hankyongella ginsenosidimutans]
MRHWRRSGAHPAAGACARPCPARRTPPAGLPAIAALIARACPAEAASWAAFARAFPTMRADSLDALLRQHLDAAQKLADPEQLWAGEAGRMLSLLLDTVLRAAAGLRAVEPLDYPAAFAALLDGAVVRPTFGRHPGCRSSGRSKRASAAPT